MFWGIGRVVFSLLVYGPQVRRPTYSQTIKKGFLNVVYLKKSCRSHSTPSAGQIWETPSPNCSRENQWRKTNYNVLHKAKCSIQTKDVFFFSINTALHIVEGSGAPLAWLAAGAVYKALFGENGGKRRRRRRGDEGGVNQIIIAGEIEFGQLIKYFYSQSAEVCWRRDSPRTLRGLWKSWRGGGKRVKSKYKQTKRTCNVVLLKAQCLKLFYP